MWAYVSARVRPLRPFIWLSYRKHFYSAKFCILFLSTSKVCVCVSAVFFFFCARELLLCLMLWAVESAAIRCISIFDVCITKPEPYTCAASAVRFLWFLMWFLVRLHSTSTRWFVDRGHLPISNNSKNTTAICQRDSALNGTYQNLRFSFPFIFEFLDDFDGYSFGARFQCESHFSVYNKPTHIHHTSHITRSYIINFTAFTNFQTTWSYIVHRYEVKRILLILTDAPHCICALQLWCSLHVLYTFYRSSTPSRIIYFSPWTRVG